MLYAVLNGLPMSVKLIIFDLDGTLADTAVDMTNALNDVLPRNVAPVSLEEAVAVMGGAEDTVAKRLQDAGVEARRHFSRTFAQAYALRLSACTRLYPGVRETLEKLGFYSKAILSNRTADLTVPVLRWFNLLNYFIDVLGRDSGTGVKPDPGPVLHLLGRVSARPEEALMVGDCVNDIDCGRAAGVHTVAAAYGYGIDRSFIERADFVIDSFPQILQVIRQIDGAALPC